MIINNGNIQKWFFDYVEGNLSTLEIKELENFVLEHPEFHEEFRAWKESNVKNEDEIPVFTPMTGLYASIPFYETIYFKTASVLAIIMATFMGGMYIANIEDLKAQYHSSQNSYALLKPEKQVSNLDYEVLNNWWVEYQTQGNSNHTISSNYYFGQNSLVSNISNNVSIQFNEPSDIVPINETLEEVEFFHLSSLNEIENQDVLIDEINRNNSTLEDILSKRDNKYAFLEFKNRDNYGVSNRKDKSNKVKFENEVTDNTADIAEGELDGSKINRKKKKLIDNLKYIELGLGNINDPLFSVTKNNVLEINPSLSGELGITRVSTSYRNQWASSNMNSNFANFNLDTYFSNIKAGMSVGVNYLNAAEGDLENVEMNYSYIQKIKISKNANVSAGLTYSLLSVNANPQSNSQEFEISSGNYIPLNNFANKNGKYISNLGMSSWYSGKYFFGGINVTNLLNTSLSHNQEITGNYINELDYSVQLGTDYRKNIYSNTVISPYLMMHKNNNQKELWGGVTYRHKALIIGLSGSTNLTTKGMIGLQSNSLRLLYGYDLSKSDFNKKYISSHEISLRILFGNKTNSNWSRYGN